ncbi:hypothetical protein SLS60_002131 [Paraconiothyrium brasiliense]|uniref:Uncharacterized protein n=1 Tax=Paraconiothyrium brasiliense TaxID=300254 RepID=A0ABR3S196_9PLEO
MQATCEPRRERTKVRFVDDNDSAREQHTERKTGRLERLLSFRTRDKGSGTRTATFFRPLAFRSMVNLDESGSHSDFHRHRRGDGFERFLDQQPFYQRAHPERFTPSPQPHTRNHRRAFDINMLSRNDEASQNGDRALSHNTQRASSNTVLDIIEGYQEQRSSPNLMPLSTTAPNLSRLADPVHRDHSELRQEPEEHHFAQRSYALPSFTSLARPMDLTSPLPAPVQGSVPTRGSLHTMEEQQLEQVEKTIARILQTDERARNMTDAEKDSLKKRTGEALLMAADMAEEKSKMDTKIASLRESHRLFTQQAHELVSRWSPDSSLTSVSAQDLIDGIPSDEEPEICEADVAMCLPVTKVPSGSVRVVGNGRPALNKRQREEMAVGQDSQLSQAAEKSAFDKLIQRKPAINELKRAKAAVLLNKGDLEPFPTYVDHFEEEERVKNLGIPHDESQASTQTWVDRHVDVKERPVSIACDPDVPDNVEIGRNGASPYLHSHTGVAQYVDGSINCEKCGKTAEVYMQCEIPMCNLSVCFDCALMMQAQAERKRIDAWKY